MTTHSQRLRYALELREMKPSVLSYKTGISEAAISHYLAGHYVPKKDKMKLMADALRVSEIWLAGYEIPIQEGLTFSEAIRLGITEQKKEVNVPVLGKVAGGIPIEAIADVLDYEELSPDMVRDGAEYFGLQIKGDSMEPKISDGDVVIVRKQETIDSGQIAIVCVNGDNATCKKVVLQEGGILLVPFNPSHTPTFYTHEQIKSIPITIIGRVVELRAKF